MNTMTTFFENVASQSVYLIVILLATAVVAFIIYSVWSIRSSNDRIRHAELELALKRKAVMDRKMVIENLRNDSIVLSDREEGRLLEIRKDQGLLSRKVAYNIAEIEERTARLELGVETATLFETLSKVKRHESSLFDKDRTSPRSGE